MVSSISHGGEADLRVRRLERVIEVGRSLVAELDLEVVLRRVVDVAREVTGAEHAALGVLDEGRTTLERFLTSGVSDAGRARIGSPPTGRGVLGVLIKDPRPLRLDAVGDHWASVGFPDGHPAMRSFVGVPIRVREEVYGNLYLTDKVGGALFDHDDEAALVTLADWASIAIANADGHDRMRRHGEELEQSVAALQATVEIARVLSGVLDLDRVLELVVKRARELVDAQTVAASLVDGDEMVVRAAAGRSADAIQGLRLSRVGSAAGHVVEQGFPQRFHELPGRVKATLQGLFGEPRGLIVPLSFGGEVLGTLTAIDRRTGDPDFTETDERLLESFAASAGAAVATARRSAMRERRRATRAAEDERRRWARELHDGPLQGLAGLKLTLAAAAAAADPAEATELLRAAASQVDEQVAELRDVVTDLRPGALDQLGIAAAIEALVDRARSRGGPELEVEVDLDGVLRHGDELESAVYRIVQEAVTNALKHSSARHVSIRVVGDSGHIRLEVADDGAGFDPTSATDGFGVLGMRERVALAGGRFEVDARPGGGTAVRAALPVDEAL